MAKTINLIGEKFGRLVVISEAKKKDNQWHTYWNCQCDCGNISIIPTGSLKRGLTRSCGCLRKEQYKDITGQRFGRLIALKIIATSNQRSHIWECQCDCGNIKNIDGAVLRKGATKSCGCLVKDTRFHLEKGKASENIVYYGYKRKAKNYDLEFDLSMNQFEKLTQSNCFYCGLEPSNKYLSHEKLYNGAYIYNGIDRLDNSIGYILENCVACCEWCNKSKNKRSLEEFREWAEKFIEYNIDKIKAGERLFGT